VGVGAGVGDDEGEVLGVGVGAGLAGGEEELVGEGVLVGVGEGVGDGEDEALGVGVDVGLTVGEALDSKYATKNTTRQADTNKTINTLLPIFHLH